MIGHLSSSAPTRSHFSHAAEVLLVEPAAIATETASAGERHRRQFDTELEVDLGAGATIRQTVTVELGHAARQGDCIELPVRWRPSGRTALLPSFEGQLQAEAQGPATKLTLSGDYRVGWGPLGWLFDRVVGGRIAQRSLARFVAMAALRLDAEVGRRRNSFTWRPPQRPPPLHER